MEAYIYQSHAIKEKPHHSLAFRSSETVAQVKGEGGFRYGWVKGSNDIIRCILSYVPSPALAGLRLTPCKQRREPLAGWVPGLAKEKRFLFAFNLISLSIYSDGPVYWILFGSFSRSVPYFVPLV